MGCQFEQDYERQRYFLKLWNPRQSRSCDQDIKSNTTGLGYYKYPTKHKFMKKTNYHSYAISCMQEAQDPDPSESSCAATINVRTLRVHNDIEGEAVCSPEDLSLLETRERYTFTPSKSHTDYRDTHTCYTVSS